MTPNRVVPAWREGPRNGLVERLPEMLLSALERRYLDAFEGSGWQLVAEGGGNTVPLLSEVLAIGRPRREDELARAMPHVLTACHEPGHAVVLALHGQGPSNRLYLGVRRLLGGGATRDRMEGHAAALSAHIPGIRLGTPAFMDTTGLPALAEFLQVAPSLAAITGIPSPRGGPLPGPLQGLERLAAALAGHRFALLVVAEPLTRSDVAGALDSCRRLQGEVSHFLHGSITRLRGTSRGGSEQNTVASTRTEGDLGRLVAFCGQVAIHTSVAAVIGSAIDSGTRISRSVSTSSGENESESATAQWIDGAAKACDQILQQHADRLLGAQAGSWWRTAVYLAAEDDAILNRAARGVRSLASGNNSHLDPLRCLALPPSRIRDAVCHGRVLRLEPPDGIGHPLGELYDTLGTCLTGEELAVLLAPPRRDIPGLAMREHGEFAVSVPESRGMHLTLGRLHDGDGRDLGPVDLEPASLNHHVLVAGTPGFGKTNTCMQLVTEAYLRWRIPFLVIEPAKTEYSRLADLPGLASHVQVFTVGGPGQTLRLNPFSPVRGAPLAGHVDLLKAVFNASFAMHAGMPQVLEQAILDVYQERGWNLALSRNDWLPAQPSEDEVATLLPTLDALHDQIETVLLAKGYAPEVHQNLGAALRSRIRSLTLGTKGRSLNNRRGLSPDRLFERPTIIELHHLRDDEEKAFVMALIFMLLYQYAEVRQRHRPPGGAETLQHVTLVEEAHRLLSASRGPAAAEAADPRGKAVAMFSDMLAEMRAYGEGFLIADQVPTKLAPDVLKNTNLKIIHRLTDPAERGIIGQSANLTESQVAYLTSLPRGLAVVHGLGGWDGVSVASAVLVQVAPFKEDRLAADLPLAPPVRPVDRVEMMRHGGCHACPSPCDFLDRLPPRRSRPGGPGLGDFCEAVAIGDPTAARSAWSRWRGSLPRSVGPAAADPGVVYCSATQLAFDWLEMVLLACTRGTGATSLRPDDRLRKEHLARALSPLIEEWTRSETALDGPGTPFRMAEQALAEGLTSSPPELPGCELCPARCKLLPQVAALELSAVATKIQQKLNGQMSRDVRLSIARPVLRAAAGQATPLALRMPPDSVMERDFFYCLLTNLEPELTGDALRGSGELREQLRS